MSRTNGRRLSTPGLLVTGLVAPALLALATAGCVDLVLGPAPDAEDPVAAFDALWTEFDRHYSFFEVKDVDWDALRAQYSLRVTPDLTDRELLGVMGEMLDHLEDGHVNIYTPMGPYSYDGWFEPYPVSFRWAMVEARVNNIRYSADQQVAWASLLELGYIHVGDFVGAGRVSDLDEAVSELLDKPGLIIDVRNNGGGSARAARLFAGLLADERFHHLDIRYRNGPEHDDFTEPEKRYIEPRSPRYTGPVVVLTNRRVFSAAEDLVLAVKRIPTVTVIGDTTGGGAGNPIFRELPNGWTFRLSRWLATDPSGWTWEGVGIAPDIRVVQTDADVDSGREPVLDTAVAVLRARIGG